MYTMVLMTALSTTGAAPDSGLGLFSCLFSKHCSCGYSSYSCCGCCGYTSYGCCGGCCGGCYGGYGPWGPAYSGGYGGGMLLDGGWAGPPYGGYSYATPYYGAGMVNASVPAVTLPGTGALPTLPTLPSTGVTTPPPMSTVPTGLALPESKITSDPISSQSRSTWNVSASAPARFALFRSTPSPSTARHPSARPGTTDCRTSGRRQAVRRRSARESELPHLFVQDADARQG